MKTGSAVSLVNEQPHEKKTIRSLSITTFISHQPKCFRQSMIVLCILKEIFRGLNISFNIFRYSLPEYFDPLTVLRL